MKQNWSLRPIVGGPVRLGSGTAGTLPMDTDVSTSVATKPGPHVGAWTGSSQWRNRPRNQFTAVRPHRPNALEAIA